VDKIANFIRISEVLVCPSALSEPGPTYPGRSDPRCKTNLRELLSLSFELKEGVGGVGGILAGTMDGTDVVQGDPP
jgi:hypothetical protein